MYHNNKFQLPNLEWHVITLPGGWKRCGPSAWDCTKHNDYRKYFIENNIEFELFPFHTEDDKLLRNIVKYIIRVFNEDEILFLKLKMCI